MDKSHQKLNHNKEEEPIETMFPLSEEDLVAMSGPVEHLNDNLTGRH